MNNIKIFIVILFLSIAGTSKTVNFRLKGQYEWSDEFYAWGYQQRNTIAAATIPFINQLSSHGSTKDTCASFAKYMGALYLTDRLLEASTLASHCATGKAYS